MKPLAATRRPRAVTGRQSPRDRHVHEVAPLGPRPVVVSDVLVTEQLPQDEPGVGAALADPAVRGHRFVLGHALAAVKLPQLVNGLERAVVLDGAGPRD